MTQPDTADPRATLTSSTGETLAKLSADRPVLVAFLRHSGCTFCRELLADIGTRRDEIESAGLGIVLVHLEDDADVETLASKYGLGDIPRISDPDQKLYATFELRRMSPLEIFNPSVWLRGFRTAILKRHGFGSVKGDVLQMPGVFLVRHGEILSGYRHTTPASTCDIPSLIQQGTQQQSSPQTS
ncbi:MAG: SelL-related redox protein [Planctomycetota bacterium]|jgi:peroxiredoxin